MYGGGRATKQAMITIATMKVDDRPQARAETDFAAVFASHRRTFFKVAYVYARNPSDREDLIQDMALQLWRSLPNFDGKSAVATFVYRLALNVAISRRRRDRRHPTTAPLELGLTVADRAFEGDDSRMPLLKALIGDLDAMSRALVLLHLEGFDHAEIAALMGLGVSNVATRLSRIRQRLKAQAIEGGMT